jgi:tRNA/tmRNA/rRNA uracil-C5-methylase (TrmA/RlmC/RlmD family)
VGDEFECDITNVAHGGVFVARHEGRVVFVTDALPGERVRVRVSEASKSSFWRADTLAVITPSTHRREHVWPEASVARAPEERPGGAEFGHIDLAYQRELKTTVLHESFERVGKLALPSLLTQPVRVSAVGHDDERNGLGWRTRVRLHVDEAGRVGPFAARSHSVISVQGLPLAATDIERVAPLGARLAGPSTLDIVAPGGIEARQLDADSPLVVTETVGERAFRVRALGFWQVHVEAPETLTAAVRAATDDALLDPQAANLDLYGGVGLLAAALGDVAGTTTRITTVESDADATDFAAENLAEWVGARAVTAKVDRYLAEQQSHASASERSRYRRATVILDPPRSGAGKAVIDALAGLAPAQVVYVACDPVALARDTALLLQHGYRLAHLEAFDLFPHTHHFECVARFARDEG